MGLTADLPIILRWWITILLVGWAAWPLTRKVFGAWEDGGYIWAKVVGTIGLTWGMMVIGAVGIASYSIVTMVGVMTLIFSLGWYLEKRGGKKTKLSAWTRVIVAEEVVFFVALVGWSWVKAHAPDINGLEKFMDFGFAKSILRGSAYPPADMWFAGESINYYFFGHFLLATLTKLSGIDLAYSFNLMLSTLFGLCFTASFVIGRQILSGLGKFAKLGGAILIAYLVTLSGNLQTIYTFTKGYAGSEDDPPPFWEIMINPFDFNNLKLGRDSYWYPNATRFIPYTIHEFPSYSFVVSDIHGHVLSIPMALLAMALLINMFGKERERIEFWEYGIFGVLSGFMFMTNALDGPIYMGLLGIGVLNDQMYEMKKDWKKLIFEVGKRVGVAGVAFLFAILPFVLYFKPFVSGIALNCPPESIAYKPAVARENGLGPEEPPYRKLGPLIIEGVEKCQRSPVWMMLVLWGFFLYCGLGLVKKWDDKPRLMFGLWGWYAIGLILFAEFFYFKDIYPQHFRSNTMFKLGYQAFMMMSVASGYAIVWAIKLKRRLWLLGLFPLLFLVSIYPYFSVKSYFGELRTYQGIYGLSWLSLQYPDDAAAIAWLNKNVPQDTQPVILEANGDSYTDYDRVSTFTGLPTVAGWTVHEWLWRGSYTPISQRAEEVRIVYETPSSPEANVVLKKYNVEYLVIGGKEKEKYANIDVAGLATLGELVFRQGTIEVYKLNSAVL